MDRRSGGLPPRRRSSDRRVSSGDGRTTRPISSRGCSDHARRLDVAGLPSAGPGCRGPDVPAEATGPRSGPTPGSAPHGASPSISATGPIRSCGSCRSRRRPRGRAGCDGPGVATGARTRPAPGDRPGSGARPPGSSRVRQSPPGALARPGRGGEWSLRRAPAAGTTPGEPVPGGVIRHRGRLRPEEDLSPRGASGRAQQGEHESASAASGPSSAAGWYGSAGSSPVPGTGAEGDADRSRSRRSMSANWPAMLV